MRKDWRDCDHEFEMSMPFDVSEMDNTYAHVYVEGTCTKCGFEVCSDYSWDISDGEVMQEGDIDEYECDGCGNDMGDDPVITDEDHTELHFCSKVCQSIWHGRPYDEEE